MQGVETPNCCSMFLFAHSQYLSTHVVACPAMFVGPSGNLADSVRPFFAHVPWMEYFSPFPNGGVEPDLKLKCDEFTLLAKDSTRAISSNN